MMEPSSYARMKLAAERFPELQGLRGALIGGVILLGDALYVLLPPLVGIDTTRAGVIGVSAAAVIGVTGMLSLDRYYAAAFGRMTPLPRARWFGLLVIPGSMMLGLTVERLRSLPAWSLFFTALAAISLWIVIRDWPFRAHYLLSCAAGLIAAGLCWQYAPVGQGAPDRFALLAIGAAMAVCGARDHALLVAAFPGGSALARDSSGAAT
jgi:hypothetical protein